MDRRPVRSIGRRRHVAVTAAVVLVVAACGGGLEVQDEAAEPPAEEPPATEEPAEPATEPETEDLPETAEDTEPVEDAGEPPGSSPADTCTIAIGEDTDAPAEDGYLDLMGPINGELEELTFAMDAALAELEEGISDGPSLEMALAEHQDTWEELVDPVVGLRPPDGAEEWHARVIDSWESVCEAIRDGRAGVAGDEERFDAFVAALRDFPSVVNELHANAACGPFEDC